MEVVFAQELDRAGLTWDYEPHTFLLADGRRYTPDFRVAEWNVYIEIKGDLKRGADKVAQAQQQGIPVRMLHGWRALREVFV